MIRPIGPLVTEALSRCRSQAAKDLDRVASIQRLRSLRRASTRTLPFTQAGSRVVGNQDDRSVETLSGRNRVGENSFTEVHETADVELPAACGASENILPDEADPYRNDGMQWRRDVEGMISDGNVTGAWDTMKISFQADVRDAASYSKFMRMAVQNGCGRLTFLIYDEMKRRHLPVDGEGQVAILGAYGQAHQWSKAMEHLRSLPKHDPMLTRSCYSAVLKACSHCEQWDSIIELMQEMLQNDVPFAKTSSHSVIRALGKRGQWQEAVAFMRSLPGKGLRPCQATYSLTIDACGDCGTWEVALDLFREMPAMAVRQSVEAYNAAIRACGRGGQWEIAVKLFYAIRNRKKSSFHAILSACAEAGKRQEAIGFLREMEKSVCEVDADAYSLAIKSCVQGGHWNTAFGLALEMRRKGIDTDITIYRWVIMACEKAGEWQKATRMFRDLVDKGMEADAEIYEIAIRAYEHIKQPDEANRLREQFGLDSSKA